MKSLKSLRFLEFCKKKGFINLNEGGNAVKGVSRINQENVKATVEKIYKELLPKIGLTEKNVALLGSTGKKLPGGSSGDIDIAIEIQPLIKKYKLKDLDEILQFLHDKASKLPGVIDSRISRGINEVHIAFPIVNSDGKQENQYVQVDLMPTDNLNFTTWMYYSPAEWESKWKGLYRNMLLMILLKYADLKILEKKMNEFGEEVPVKIERYLLDMSKGLHRAIQSYLTKTGKISKNKKTIEKKFITKDPNIITKIALGPGHSPNEILTYESLIKKVLSKDFIYKKDRDNILKEVANGIQKLGYPLPEELKNYI